jgi:hypothetical protein
MTEEPKPWTPEDVKSVCQLLIGTGWQTTLAQNIEIATGRNFPQSRVAKWYLPSGGRGIPEWLQPKLTEILGGVATVCELALGDAKAIIAEHE